MSSVSRASDRDDGEDAAVRPSRSTSWLSLRITDVMIAKTVSDRVRSLPAVAALSRGHAALVATYGAMQRVTGVAVRRLAPEAMDLEVHVVLRADATWPDIAAEPDFEEAAGDGKLEAGIFAAVAMQIREVVRSTLQEMSLPSPAEVDVFIDDIAALGD
jgi:uncharacterized alkaline shock family protein YloU